MFPVVLLRLLSCELCNIIKTNHIMKRLFSFLPCLAIVFLLFATACNKSIETTAGTAESSLVTSASQYKVTVTTIAGKFGAQGDADGKGSKARFWNPAKMVYDNRNNILYIADGTVIRSINAQNDVKTYLPFGKINNYDEILDIDVTDDAVGGSLYFITKENDLYKIEPKGKSYKLTTIVDRIYGGNEPGKLNTKDHFDLPYGMATGKNGDVYFFNQSWYTMHRISFTSAIPFEGTVKKFAGKPAATRSGDVWPFRDGTKEDATFGYGVTDMCADGKGNLYVADFRNDLLRKVTPSGVVTSLFQYENGLGVDVDGPVSRAQSNRVDQVAAIKDGSSIYFTSFGKGGFNPPALRVVKPGIDVTTLVGKSSTYGDGNGDTAAFGEIGGIATTADGKIIYVSEVGNKVIRKVVVQ